MTRARQVSMWALGLFMIGSGVMHFASPAFYVAMMPPPLPYPLALVYVSGVCEAAFGALLLIPRTRRVGAWGIVATLIGVYPANIYHAVSGGLDHPDLPPMMANATVAWLRLPLQAVLVYWAWLFTGSRRPAARTGGHSAHPGS